MNTIVIRLKEYLEDINVKPSVAETLIGVANGTLSKPFKKETSIKTDTLEKFLFSYNEINPIWLLTGVGNKNKVDESKLFDVELKKKDRQIARLQQEIVALKDNTIVGSAPPTLESNVNYKELAEARLETIDGLKFKIATLENVADYDKSSQRGDLGDSKTPTGAMKKEEVHK